MAALVFALPVEAQWRPLGAVDVSPASTGDLSWNDLAGPVARLGFRAEGGRLSCAHIRVVYPSGNSQDVFSGEIFRGQSQTVAFPDGPHPVARVDVACHTDDPRGAKLVAWADMAGPTQDQPPPMQPSRYAPPESGWTPLGYEDFGRMNRHAMMLSERSTRPVTVLGVEPVNGAARCVSATAIFADGSAEQTAPNAGRPLVPGSIYHVAIATDGRALNGLGLTCEALNGDHVTIRVLATG